MMNNKVDIFHIGPQKAATTWLYECLQEHPKICCAENDSVHYFDMFFNSIETEDYHENFPCLDTNKKVIDMTHSYIRSPWAPKRIHEYNPNGKIILCMRNPIKRAFSHYWHEKKKEKYRFDFEECFQNYDLYSSWIEPGFYARHIEKYLEFFPKDQILVQNFDDLKKDPESFWLEALDFMNVDTSIRPEILDEKSNQAGTRGSFPGVIFRPHILLQKANNIGKKKFPKLWDNFNLKSRIESVTKSKYEQGIPGDIEEKLQAIYRPEIERTEKLLEINLTSWKS